MRYSIPNECRGSTSTDATAATFYIQAPCVVPNDKQWPRPLIGLIIACAGVFIYFYVVLYIDYIKSV